MKTLIWFREGLSGHYLKSLVDDRDTKVSFRMDPWWPGLYDRPMSANWHDDCLCLHPIPNFDSSNFDLVLTVLAHKKIYHAAYNVFYKKLLVEQQLLDQHQQWQSDMVSWYDRAFYNIDEYVRLFSNDAAQNTNANVVNFDHMLDEEYIEQIFKQFFDRSMSSNMRSIVQQYKQKQLILDLSREQTSMKDIVDAVPDQYFLDSPWFAAYCIYKFENNNQLHESQRCWSINTIRQPIDRIFLLDISSQYQ